MSEIAISNEFEEIPSQVLLIHSNHQGKRVASQDQRAADIPGLFEHRVESILLINGLNFGPSLNQMKTGHRESVGKLEQQLGSYRRQRKIKAVIKVTTTSDCKFDVLQCIYRQQRLEEGSWCH